MRRIERQSALTRAAQWAAALADRVTYEDAAGGYVRARIRATHPADERVDVAFSAVGTSRPGARELVLLEARSFAQRCYLHPGEALDHADVERGLSVFQRGDQASIERVQACLRHRHNMLGVTGRSIGLASIACTGSVVTVDDVVDAVVARARDSGYTGQGSLL